MTFQDVATLVQSLYREAAYESALEIAQSARDGHPDEDNTLTFWEACLLARLGRDEEAVETLLAGVERGEWWPTGKLIDSDLDSVRAEPGWETVHAHCLAMTQSLLAERPRPRGEEWDWKRNPGHDSRCARPPGGPVQPMATGNT